MTTRFTSAAVGRDSEYLVNDRDTHSVLDRKFSDLGIVEPVTVPSPQEEDWKAMGMKRGIHYAVKRPSKRERLRHAVRFQHDRSGNKGVLQLIKALNEPVVYSSDPQGFKEFSSGLNRILRFYGWNTETMGSSTLSIPHGH